MTRHVIAVGRAAALTVCSVEAEGTLQAQETARVGRQVSGTIVEFHADFDAIAYT
jgi:hypothetical protein